MNLTSIKAPALYVSDKYAPVFSALDATSTTPIDIMTLGVRFQNGHDEAAFNLFTRDVVEGVKLVLSADVYNRCMPAPFDAERAVKYIGKAPGVTDVRFVPNTAGDGAPNMLQVRTADEASANLLRGILKDRVVLAGSRTTADIIIAPGEG